MSSRVKKTIIACCVLVVVTLGTVAGYSVAWYTSQNSYKTVTIGATWSAVTFEIPTSWSVVRNVESVGITTLPDLPTGSVGQTDVAYGDLNWSQVDFLFAYQDIVDRLVAPDEEVDTGWARSQETVGGVVADVFTFLLDEDGEVSKGGTGGKEYILRIPKEFDGEKTLMILKQAKGDEAFERGFEHLLQTLRFTKP